MKRTGFTHATRLVSVKNGEFNLENAVLELMREGLQPNPKNITVFVYMDGFKLFGSRVTDHYVYIGDTPYPLIILPTDFNIIHCFGDVQLKYD